MRLGGYEVRGLKSNFCEQGWGRRVSRIGAFQAKRKHKTQALMGATRPASEFFQRLIALVLAFPVVAVSEVPIILS